MVVAVLLIAGDQVPVMLLFEVVGKAEILLPETNGPTCVKVGNVGLFTVTFIIEVVAHIGEALVVGVNV